MNAADKNSPPRIRTMIVEDQGMVRAFFERWLSTMPRFVLVASARSGEEALAQVEAARPDVVLVDYQLPGMDGLEFMHAARQVRPQLRALVVTSLVDALALTRVRESGVEGYVEKDASPETLADAMGAVADGRQYFSKKFQETMAKEGANAEGVAKILSRREQQVLSLVLGRKTNREIAGLMALSERTVEFHRANMMAKLSATNMTELVARAKQRGLGV
ncbi:MAG: LuxR family transcriptional regulator [Rariglobus sp.]|jgi:DNA-binding NarL/FixJ family response regulator|nr:LuxR family transcriptional regulator [Rariglobus sp.]